MGGGSSVKDGELGFRHTLEKKQGGKIVLPNHEEDPLKARVLCLFKNCLAIRECRSVKLYLEKSSEFF